MLSLATDAASLMDDFPVRIRASMVRRTLPFSTLIQFFDVGTNQLLRAARSLTLFPSRLVVFGRFPFARSAPIHAAAAALFPPTGTARSEPPRKPGIGWPLVWLGITNCATLLL